MSRFLAPLFVVALVLAGCGDDDETADPATSTSSEPTSTTEAPTTTTTSVPDPVVDGRSCTSPDGFEVSYPAPWEAVSDCGQFGPPPLEEPEPATDERPGTVSIYVDPVPFSTASEPSAADTERTIGVVDGLQAVRVDGEATGGGLYPEGSRFVRWFVDLDVGADEGNGTLIADVVDREGQAPQFETAAAVLDLMMRTMTISAASEREDNVVARFEGGGQPFTVIAVAAASRPSTCFNYVDVDADPACVQAAEAGEVSLTGMALGAGEITVGIVGPDVYRVVLDTDADDVSIFPVSYAGRDSRGFAAPVDSGAVDSVRLFGKSGAELTEISADAAIRPVE